jgi:hypothetical protein
VARAAPSGLAVAIPATPITDTAAAIRAPARSSHRRIA